MAALPNITPELLKQYQDEIARVSSGATAKRKSAALNNFFNWAKSNGIVDDNPLETKPEVNTKEDKKVQTKTKSSYVSFANIARISILGALVIIIFLLTSKAQLPIDFTKIFGSDNVPESSIQVGQKITDNDKINNPQTPAPTEIPAVNQPDVNENKTFNVSSLKYMDILKAEDGSGGDVWINPDGNGVANVIFEGNGENFFNTQAVNLTSGSLYYGLVANNSNGENYDLLRLQSGTNKETQFSIDGNGNTFAAGSLQIDGNEVVNGSLSVDGIVNSSSYLQNGGNFNIVQNESDSASIVKNGTALSDVLTLTLDERGKPETANSKYSTLTLNRFDGSAEAAALHVDNGNAIFDGQLQLGRYSSNPDSIGEGSLVYNTTDDSVYFWNGSSWISVGTAVTTPFNTLTSGTNTVATMVVGSGASLSASGTGTITATDLVCSGCVSNSELANSAITFAGDSGSSAISLGGTQTIAGSGGIVSTTQSGSTLTVSIVNDSLDFTQLKDAMALDASTDIALGSGTLSTSGLGALNFASTGQVTFAGNVDANSGVDVTGNLNIGASSNLIFGGTTTLAESTAANDSGAYNIGAFDEFDNSNSTNVQAVLNDLDAAITTGSSWTLNGDSGSETINNTNAVVVAGGTNGIDTAVTATDTVTLNLDTTEISGTTFGSGSGFTWVFDVGVTDPTIAFASDAITLTAANTTLSGDLAINGGNITTAVTADSTLTVTGTTTANGTLTANGLVTLGDNGDTVAINSSDWDINATGDASGIGSLGLDGDITNTQTTPSIYLVDSTGASDDYSFNVDGSTFTIVNDTDVRTDLSIDGSGAATFGGIVNLASSGSLVFTDTGTTLAEGTSAVDSGAYKVGVFDEFANSNSTNVQAVLNDLDASITAISSWTLAGDSGSSQIITGGDTANINGGTNGIDTVASATDILTLNLDTTEIGGTTFGSGSGFTWVFDAGATDPTIAFASDAITLTAATTTLSGDLDLADDNWIGLSSSAGLIEFDDQSTDEVNILNANVGIGTSAPSTKLEVSGGAVRIGSTGYGTLVELYRDAAPRGYLDNSFPGIRLASASTYDVQVVNATGGGITVRDTSGNVGIGDTTPDAILEVLGSTEQLRLTYTDGTVDSRFTVDSSGNLTIDNTGTKTIIADDLQISGDDLIMGTNTSGMILVADGTNFNPTAVSGDITIDGTGATSIGNDKVVEADLKAVDAASDEECLTYETTTGDFEWQSCSFSSMTSFTAAGDSGGGQTISDGNTLSIVGGTNGIDTVDSVPDTITLNLDTTEISGTTFGSGSGFTWVFDVGVTDPTIAFASDAITLTAASTTLSGDLAVNGNDITAAGDLTITPVGADTNIAGALNVTGSADDIQVVVKGNATQTSNLMEWQNSGGTAKALINGSGGMALGTSSIPSYAFNNFSESSGDLSQSTYYHTLIYPTYTPTNELTANHHALYTGMNVNDSNATGNLTGTFTGGTFNANAVSNTRTISALLGGNFVAQSLGRSGSYAPVTTMTSGQFAVVANGSSVTSTRGIVINTPTVTTGSIATSYGLYINNINTASANYAIVTNAGNIVFNEGGDSATDFRVEGDTNTHLIFADASADNVGINTSGADAKLDVLAASGEQLRLTYSDGVTYTGFTTDSSGNLTIDNTGTKTVIADDLQISGDDLIMGTNTSGYLLIADGTNFNPTAMSGDITIDGTGATTIGNDKITEAKLKAVDAAVDEECLTYETTTGDFEWQTCAAGGAMNSFTAAGDSGGGQTISDGNTLSIVGGTNGIDTVDSVPDTITLNLDTTEISGTTFGSGSGFTWVFDVGVTDPTIAFASDAITLTAANTTLSGDLAINGGNITTAVTADSTLTVTGTTTTNGTLTANGVATIGDNGDTVAINSSDWDINTAGDMSNIGTISSNGDWTNSQTTPSIFLTDTTASADDYSINTDGNAFNVNNETDGRIEVEFVGDGGINLGDNTATKTIDVGGVTASAADTINIATNSTAADVITIGNSNAATTLALTGGTAWSVTTAGLITTADDLAVNGGDITTTSATGNLFNTNATTLNIGGAATTLNLADAATTKAIDIGGVTADGVDTINIATNATSADTINIGNVHASTITNISAGTINLLTDSTGNAEVVLPNDSIGPNEVFTTGQTDEYCLTYESTGSTWAWQTCGGSSSWSGLTDPTGNTTLSMAAYNTAFSWDPTADAAEAAFSMNFDGEDSTGGGDEDQTLLSLNQTSNGTDVDEAADALLTFANSDANDPVNNAIRFDAGAAGTDFTYGINFDAASVGTAEIVLQNGEMIDNATDGKITLTGGDLFLADTYTFNIGGVATDVAYNVIADSVAAASANMNSDDDLYIEGNLEVDGNIYDSNGNIVAGYWTLSGSNLYGTSTDYKVGIGTNSPVSRLHLATNTTTTTGKSVLIIDQLESQDIFTASASGSTKLTLQNDGTLKLYNASSSITNDSGDITINSASNVVSFSTDSISNVGTLTADIGIFTTKLQVAHSTAVAYSRFGSVATSHGGAISAGNDLMISGDLELNGNFYLDGNIIANAQGSSALVLCTAGGSDCSTTSQIENTLSSGTWVIENGSNVGKAALIVNQTKAGDLFTASASGVTKFTIANNGDVSLGDNSGTDLTVGGGTGKIDAGTVDPPYTINGKKFATFMAGMIGVKEEVTGNIITTDYVDGIGYRNVIDFNDQLEGSDLWLFGKTTNIKDNINKLVALLTPQYPTRVWYDVDTVNNKVAIYSAKPTAISYRFTAPRFDANNWSNSRDEGSSTIGFVINQLDQINPAQNFKDFASSVESFATIIADNIESGFVKAQSIITPSIATDLITPMDSDTIKIALADTQKLVIENNNTNEVVTSFDNQGNATLSGTLTADTVKATNIDQIESLLSEIQLNQDLLNQAQSQWGEELVVTDLYVTGQLAANSLSLTQSLALGVDFVIDVAPSDGSTAINTISNKLSIQSLALAPIEFMAGKLKINTNGDVEINGNLNVAGKIKSNSYEIPDVDNEGQILAAIDASGSATFKDVAINSLVIAAPEATESAEIVDGVITTNSSIGKAMIPAGVTEITIQNPKITDYSMVYVTPTSTTENYVLYIKEKSPGYFIVGFTDSLDIDVNFNWWIVDTGKQTNEN